MDINSGGNITSGNRSAFVLVIILAVLIVILLGVLYFMKQRELGEGIMGQPTQIKTHTIKELRELTTAPENNPDIQPNPVLTALTTAPENSVSIKADSQVLDKLTAPKNQ